jgi:hypothetical protein
VGLEDRSRHTNVMTTLSLARREWEQATTPYPLQHKQSYGEVVEEPFRRYGDAIAWLDWGHDCAISKIETLRPRSGAASELLSFLKKLATKHGVRIYGNPVVYEPTCPQARGSPLSQDELKEWYRKQGFAVGWSANGVPYAWFPDAPKD